MKGFFRIHGGVVRLYRELWYFAHGKRWILICALLLLTGAQIVMLAIPYFAGKAIDTLQMQGAAGLFIAGLWMAGIIGINLVSWALHAPGRFLEQNIALLLRERMSQELIDRLMQLPLAWHEKQHSGATSHRLQQSVKSLTGFAENQFVYLNSAVRLAGPAVALWLIDPRIGLTAVLGFVVISTSMLGFDRRMVSFAHRENDAERRYASTLLDSLGNATTLFALRQARTVAALLQRRLADIFVPVKQAMVINEVKWFTVDMLSRVLACVLVGMFAWLGARKSGAAQTGLMLGSVYMVWEYAQQAAGVVSAVTGHFQSFARQQADYQSADIIREAPPATHLSPQSRAARMDWRSLRFSSLRFRHPESRLPIATLDELAFDLLRGKRYALIGASGSGKSTLLRILAGLYAADSIRLTADSIQFESADDVARFLRGTSTLIPQDAEVFEGTLAENLSLCESVDGPPSRETFDNALMLAQATEFIATSENGTAGGLDAVIAERGANWSGGQRSRVALARGILAARGSSLLLLDEPTASLDPRTEAKVYGALFDAFPETCIVSSVHRLNLLDRFDYVLVMRDGRLVAQGSVAELQSSSSEFGQMMAAYNKSAAQSDTAQSPDPEARSG